MKNKLLAVGISAIVLVFAVNVYAVGQNGNVGTGNQAQPTVTSTGTGAQVKNQNQIKNQGESNQIQNQEQEEQINADEHRSAVADFVQGLLEVADREGGIGKQVRVVAQQQKQSSDTTTQAMEEIQTRNKVKTFFIGTDYKNLGAIRSETVQTRNRLEQLNQLMENVQNEADKTELQNQIQTLEQEQTKIESFIKTQEGKFSLFGWAFRLFSR